MPVANSSLSLFRTLLLLTLLFIFAQVAFLYANSLTNNVYDTFVGDSITPSVLMSKIFLFGLFRFLVAQIMVYASFIGIIWYLAMTAGEYLRLRRATIYAGGIGLWCVSLVAVIAANNYFSPNSFFAKLLREQVVSLSAHHLFTIFITVVGLWILLGGLALLQLIDDCHRRQHRVRHALMVLVIGVIVFLQWHEIRVTLPRETRVAAAEHPDVIIIGLDALRPDFIGFNHTRYAVRTPTIDTFLASATDFTNATTTLARTFPSWSSILTGRYPLHNRVRGNNTNLSFIDVATTVPKAFQAAGYETIYGTDDTRFNNTNEIFGFDHLVCPTMGLNDLLLGTINDFPLTNLLIPTVVGKYLFPLNYANHGTATSYVPGNFLTLIQERLHQRSQKPLFLSVHFTLSHWPFYWFNDKQPLANRTLDRYVASIMGVDAQLQAFLTILQQNHLLDHSIVVLLSDHGISMGLPGERPITMGAYQGDRDNIKKIPFSHYSSSALQRSAKNAFAIDTSYGYGGDVLSLTQSHTLLAFRGYGVNLGAPQRVAERVSMLDIGPTLLSLLKLPVLSNADGMTLEPYFFAEQPVVASMERPFFLETTFSIDALEKENISVSDVLQKTLRLYEVNLQSGLIAIKVNAEKIMNHDKEFAVLQGHWLLAKYPQSERSRLIFKQHIATEETYLLPAYYVLVDLKTGAWTTELNSAFAQKSPAQMLLNELQSFYGDELKSLEISAKKPPSAGLTALGSRK